MTDLQNALDGQVVAIDRFDKALKYVDRLLVILPEYSHFNISKIISDSTWNEIEKDEACKLHSYIDTLLVDKLKYADEQNGRFWIELNNTGRAAQKVGGHFLYQRKIREEKELAEIKQRIDLKNAKRIHQTYWLTLGLSIAGFFLAIGKIIYDLISRK